MISSGRPLGHSTAGRSHDLLSAIATTVGRITPLSSIPLVAIVDDDESVRTAMGSLLRSLGLDARLFTTAAEFLASPQLHISACLITDVQMPGMSGLELQNELAARGENMPVILITAYPEDELRERAIAAGAAGFFGKPVDSQALIATLEAALKRN